MKLLTFGDLSIQFVFDFRPDLESTGTAGIHSPSARARSLVFFDFLLKMDNSSLYDNVFDHCSPATIFRFGRTCRAARNAVQDYKRRAFNIDRHLSRFFGDPLSFRVLQACTQAVISGSNVLQFMDRTVNVDSDLDLYVTVDHALAICDWLVEKGGKDYVFQPSDNDNQEGLSYRDVFNMLLERLEISPHDPSGVDVDEHASTWGSYGCACVKGVFNFIGNGGKHVQLIVMLHTPMDTILGFHSTAVMNAITYRGAYSLYPKGTFEERCTLACDTREVWHEAAIAKYAGRGWARKTAIQNNDPSMSFLFEAHCTGDHKTWVIQFDIEAIAKELGPVGLTTLPMPLHLDLLSLNSFSLTKNPDLALVEMQFHAVKPSFFMYRYTVTNQIALNMKEWFKVIDQTSQGLREMRQRLSEGKCDVAMKAWNDVFFIHNRGYKFADSFDKLLDMPDVLARLVLSKLESEKTE